MVNESESSAGVIYWALNGYGVTVFDLCINIFIVVLGVWIIILNVLVLHTLLKIQRSREPTDLLLCSLAVADTLAGAFLLYNTSYNLSNFQVLEECAFRLGIIQVIGLSGVFHMTALTIDRYLKIAKPFYYATICNKASVVATSVVIWVLTVIFGLAPLMGWYRQPDGPVSESEPICGFFAVFPKTYLLVVVILFWCPSIVMVALYMHIFQIASRHARVIRVQEKGDSGGKERHSWKYTKTVGLIIGLYFASWLPTGAVIMMDINSQLDDRTTVQKGTLLLYVSSVAFVNSLANPIIYAFKITSVRIRFRSVFCRKHAHPDIEESKTEMTYNRQKRVLAASNTVLSEISESE